MTEATPYERRWLDVLDELRNCPDPNLRVTRDHQGPLIVEPADASAAFGEIAQQDGVLLDPALQGCFLRFDGLGACWGFGEEESDPLFAGEFNLSPLMQTIRRRPPVERYPDPSPEQLELLSELRDFDGTPMSGVGSISSLRVRQGPAHNPEIWFSDGALGMRRMDVDLCGYLDALRITKGTYGWQYLFADVDLSDEDHEVTAEFLTEMLAVFTDLFPAHDYEPLRARLAERLR